MSQNPSLCGLQLNYIMVSLQNHSMWSLEMLDLSGKLPIGILNQRQKVFGLFDECLEFRHQTAEVGLIEGQYCDVSYESSLKGSTEVNRTHGLNWKDIGFVAHERNLKLQSGVCAPASCGPEELKSFMNLILSKADLVASQVSCSKARHISEHFTAWDFLAIPFFVILILVVAASTYCDIRQRRSGESRQKNLLTAFSLYTNTKELLKIDTSHSPATIECLNGLRVIAAFLVISCHRISRAIGERNLLMPRPIKTNFLLQFMMRGGGLAVDIFLISGAILVTKSCLKAFKSGKFNLLKFYFNRYMRYGPGTATAVLFMVSFIPHCLVNGPFVKTVGYEADGCRRHWLATILMTQTYTNRHDICLGHLWYLHTDFHLYLITPIITYVLWKYRLNSLWLLVPVSIVTQGIGYYVTVNELEISFDVYRWAHYRLGQWIMGTIFGFFMYHAENSIEKFNISKKVRNLIWIMTIFGFNYFYTNAPAGTIIFSFLVGWTILTFHHFQSGGIVRWFLSHPLWQPLAKLTLSIYIVHEVYLMLISADVQELAFYKTSWLLHIYIGDVAICTALGFLFYNFVEAPFTNSVNYFMRSEKKVEENRKFYKEYVPLVSDEAG